MAEGSIHVSQLYNTQGWTGTENRPWHFLVQAAHHHLYTVYIYIYKEVSSAHQACIYLILNTAKAVIL